LERYGATTIEETETFFYHDSVAVVNMLKLTWGDEREQLRWLWALRSVDELLDCFRFTLEQKLQLLTNLKEGFAREFNMNKALKLQLDNKNRSHKNSIETLLNKPDSDTHAMKELLTLLAEKNVQLQPIANKILLMQQNGTLEVPLDNLLGSYIHMLLNRITISNPRLHELVLYDFLFRYYQSAKARAKAVVVDAISELPG
jgi:thiopeptide-type bacteriocin biosynthesis protein